MAQALVGVDVGREQRGEVSHAGLQTADEVMEGIGRLPALIAEDVAATVDAHQALVDMHRAARCSGQGLGHAHHGQAMLECDFLEQVLEQESLVGQQQRIAVKQIDLELADAHLVHEGVTGQA